MDRELESDPTVNRPDPGVLALMAAARMPQSLPFTSPGSEWKPTQKKAE